MSAQDAILGEIVRLADAGLDRHEYVRRATRVLRRAVPCDGVSVVWLDPAAGLPVDTWIDESLEVKIHEADGPLCARRCFTMAPIPGRR